MTWSTAEIKHEGFPLLLRRPDYLNVWKYKKNFSQLIGVMQTLEKVNPNGLPEQLYNQSLADFDHYMCSAMNISDGIIFLIETFGGKRNYYFYTLPQYDISALTEKAKTDFNVNIRVLQKEDAGWGFLKDYPVKLFPKEM